MRQRAGSRVRFRFLPRIGSRISHRLWPRLWPDTLFGRLAMILVIGMFAGQLLTSTIWFDTHENRTLEIPARLFASRLADSVRLLELAPTDDARRAIAAQLSDGALSAAMGRCAVGGARRAPGATRDRPPDRRRGAAASRRAGRRAPDRRAIARRCGPSYRDLQSLRISDADRRLSRAVEAAARRVARSTRERGPSRSADRAAFARDRLSRADLSDPLHGCVPAGVRRGALCCAAAAGSGEGR